MNHSQTEQIKLLRNLSKASVSDCSKAIHEFSEITKDDSHLTVGLALLRVLRDKPEELLKIAADSRTPSEILAGMAFTDNSELAFAIVQNPNTPLDTKEMIARDTKHIETENQKREENISKQKERRRDQSIEDLILNVDTLTQEVNALRQSLVKFSKAVAERDKELVNAINRKSSYTIQSGFSIDFSQF